MLSRILKRREPTVDNQRPRSPLSIPENFKINPHPEYLDPKTKRHVDRRVTYHKKKTLLRLLRRVAACTLLS